MAAKRSLRSVLQHLAVRSGLARYRRDENGGVTVEAVLWLNFFLVFLFGIAELAFVFHGQARILEIAQDANRGFAVGRFETEAETAAWAKQALQNYSDEITTFTIYDEATSVIFTGVSIPASDLAGNMGFFRMLKSIDVEVVAQQVLEY